MPVLSAEERIGTQIAGRYTITAVLGEGGMGTVFEAEHTWTGRSVALKLLKPELAKNPDLVTRFLSEARAAAKLKHPNVVDILDMGQGEEEGVFLAMEKLEGEPLSARAKRSALPVEEAVALLVPVMDALSVAHEKFSIVHRDLKPDNIFLATDGRGGIVPKLLDFGIAKVTDDLFAANTHTGTLIGTPWYMSPEQALADKGLGPSLGCVVHRGGFLRAGGAQAALPRAEHHGRARDDRIQRADPSSGGRSRPFQCRL